MVDLRSFAHTVTLSQVYGTRPCPVCSNEGRKPPSQVTFIIGIDLSSEDDERLPIICYGEVIRHANQNIIYVEKEVLGDVKDVLEDV